MRIDFETGLCEAGALVDERTKAAFAPPGVYEVKGVRRRKSCSARSAVREA